MKTIYKVEALNESGEFYTPLQPTPLAIAKMDFETALECLQNCADLYLKEILKDSAQVQAEESKQVFELAKHAHEIKGQRLNSMALQIEREDLARRRAKVGL